MPAAVILSLHNLKLTPEEKGSDAQENDPVLENGGLNLTVILCFSSFSTLAMSSALVSPHVTFLS